MTWRSAFVALLLAMAVGPTVAQATGCVNDRYGNPQCPPPGGACLKNSFGDVKCSRADGGILLDRYRDAVCGPGQCIADRNGRIFCSDAPRGSSALNLSGDPVCTSGCVPASADQCSTLGQ